MCGIVGIIGDSDPSTVRRLTGALSHRGPDAEGFYIDPSCGVHLGHTRLAILDRSSCGAQPMTSRSGRFVIVFNGEIYNHRELQLALQNRGCGLRGRSDTEVLLETIDVFGLEHALDQSDGMFAFALYDLAGRNLYLARDRFGEKPLYYGWLERSFVFASELKAFYSHPAFAPEIDRNALRNYFTYNYVPTPSSIFRNVHKLAQGALLTLSIDKSDDQSFDVTRYYDMSQVINKHKGTPWNGTFDSATTHLDGLLRKSVSQRMIADVPVGCFLSGGVDSSITAAYMQQLSSQRVKTFSIGFGEDGYNEAPVARRVAKHLGTDHHELYVRTRDAMDVIPGLSTIWDEPFADPSQIPTSILCEFARRNVAVCLSGDAGDELFCGYKWYEAIARTWRKVGWLPDPLRTVAAAVLRFSAQRYASRGRLRILLRLLESQGPEAYYCDRHSLVANPVLPSERVESPLTTHSNRVSLSDYRDFMSYIDMNTFLPDGILVKVDRASMAVALETRVPLLARSIVEWSFSLPVSFKVTHDGTTKQVLRRLLARYIPEELISRPKQGFSVPIAAWLRGGLRDWAETLLCPATLADQGFLNVSQVMRYWKEHLTNVANHEIYLWRVLMFQQWFSLLKPGR